MYQETIELLGNELTIKVIDTNEQNLYKIMGINENGEGTTLYSYDSQTDSLESNKREIEDLVSEYERRTNVILKALIMLSDSVI